MIGSERSHEILRCLGRDPQEPPLQVRRIETNSRGNFEQNQANLSDQLLLDVAVSGADQTTTGPRACPADLQSAEKKLKTKPDDLDVRLARVIANFRLGENQKAFDDLQVVIGKTRKTSSRTVPGHRPRPARQEARRRSELEKFQRETSPEHSKVYLAAVVAAELGEGADKAFETTLEAAIRKQPKDADLR